MQVLEKDKVIYRFNQNNPCVYSVADGETFWVETDDCYSGQIQDETTLRTDIDISVMDCAVGPIEVKGARKEDVLKIDILAIETADHGVMVTKKGMGILGEQVKNPDTKIIRVKDGFAYITPEIRLPLTPMIGVLGVYPRDKEDIHCAIPGDHGSNMDTKLIKVGSSVYFPVFKDGAGIALGDLHACMGDGELDGTGIEIAGRVCLHVKVIHGKSIKRPIIETDEALYFIASRENIHDAIQVAVDDTVKFLEKKKSVPFTIAYRLLSAACDIQISELVNDTLTVRVRVPKLNLQIDSLFD